MRDARPESRQERGAGRNRDLARRNRILTAAFLRILIAIVVDGCAFFLWDLSSRSPARLVRDLGNGLRRPATALRGFTRFGAGALLLVAGAILLLPLALRTETFTILETWTVLTGLLAEHLVQPAARPAK